MPLRWRRLPGRLRDLQAARAHRRGRGTEAQEAARDLAAHVDRVPGLEGLGATLAALGVLTKEQLGKITDSNWADLLKHMKMKRVDVPEDLHDPSRLGPGHIQSLEDLRIEALNKKTKKQQNKKNNKNYKINNSGSLSIGKQKAGRSSCLTKQYPVASCGIFVGCAAGLHGEEICRQGWSPPRADLRGFTGSNFRGGGGGG